MNPFRARRCRPAAGAVSRARMKARSFSSSCAARSRWNMARQSFAWQEGDTLYFDADTPHRLHNPHKTAAQVMCVFLEK